MASSTDPGILRGSPKGLAPQDDGHDRAWGFEPRLSRPLSDHIFSSLNLLATSSVMASTAACASGPMAETMIEVPGPADSIINPMIELPPTVSWPLVTPT